MEDNLTQGRSHITCFPHPMFLLPYLLKKKKDSQIHKYELEKDLAFLHCLSSQGFSIEETEKGISFL